MSADLMPPSEHHSVVEFLRDMMLVCEICWEGHCLCLLKELEVHSESDDLREWLGSISEEEKAHLVAYHWGCADHAVNPDPTRHA